MLLMCGTTNKLIKIKTSQKYCAYISHERNCLELPCINIRTKPSIERNPKHKNIQLQISIEAEHAEKDQKLDTEMKIMEEIDVVKSEINFELLRVRLIRGILNRKYVL